MSWKAISAAAPATYHIVQIGARRPPPHERRTTSVIAPGAARSGLSKNQEWAVIFAHDFAQLTRPDREDAMGV